MCQGERDTQRERDHNAEPVRSCHVQDPMRVIHIHAELHDN